MIKVKVIEYFPSVGGISKEIGVYLFGIKIYTKQIVKK